MASYFTKYIKVKTPVFQSMWVDDIPYPGNYYIDSVLVLKRKFIKKASWFVMKDLTKRNRTPLTICKYLFKFLRYLILNF